MSSRHATPGLQPPPHAVLMQMVMGKWVSAAISVLAKLGIADLVESGPKSPKELAEATSTHERSLYRVLRAAASSGVFTELEDGRFANSVLSEHLRSDAKPCVKNLAVFLGGDLASRCWNELLWTVQTGRPATYKVYGAGGFQVLKDRPDDLAIFNSAMSNLSQMDSPVIAGAYDFSPFEHIVDIAGGLGTLLAAILERTPKLQGELFDMPEVIESARTSPILAPHGDRVKFVGGDFFKEVPAADAYVMKHILHDWDDAEAVQILQSCRRAIRPGGKMLVVEQVVSARNEPGMAKWMDLEMLVLPGGRERTEREWQELFKAGGFHLDRIIHTHVPQCILEGSPA